MGSGSLVLRLPFSVFVENDINVGCFEASLVRNNVSSPGPTHSVRGSAPSVLFNPDLPRGQEGFPSNSEEIEGHGLKLP